MQENQDSVEMVDEIISDLRKVAELGPQSMGSGFGGGSATELANEKRWIESLAGSLRRTRKRAVTAEQVDSLTAIGKRWDIRVAPWGAVVF
jgi:hypothetical protein